MAGYSTTPLIQKLGIKPHMQCVFVSIPTEVAQIVYPFLPNDIHVAQSINKARAVDYVHIFATTRAQLEKEVSTCLSHVQEKGMLWISWPKKSSKLQTDLSEQILRDILLQKGFVDIKVCAVDDTWSGLKFVRRIQK